MPTITRRWVQLEYGSVNAYEHVEGEAGAPVPADPLIEDSTPIATMWRFRDFRETSTDPQPSPDYAGPLAVFSWSNSTRNPIRKTFIKEVPLGQYEVRFKRVNPKSSDDKVTDDVAIGSVRSIQPDLANYDGRTLTMVEIRASGQLNGTLSQFNGVVEQQACYIKQAGSDDYFRAPSSNPGRVLFAWLRGGFDSAGRRLYGAGLPLSRIDTENLDQFSEWCYRKELYFDAVIDQPLSVIEVANRIARCGRATLSCASGKWGVVWDEGRLPVTAMFTPMNMLPGTFKITYATGDQPDEIVLNYIDRTTWKPNSVFARAPGVDAPQRSVSEELFGATTSQQTVREVRLMMSEILNRSRRISWQADIEGLTVRKGDVVSLSHDMSAWGVGGRLVGGTSTVVQVDREVTLNGAQQYLAVTTPAGYYQVCRVQVGSGETDTLTLLDPIMSSADEDAVEVSPDEDIPVDFKYQFDTVATPGWKVKVVAIDPAPGFDGVKITAVDEVDAYYQAIDGDYGVVVPRTNPRAPVIRDLVVGEEPIRAGAGFSVNLLLTWVPSGSYQAARLRTSVAGGAWQVAGIISGSSASVVVPPVATIDIELVPFDGAGRKGVAFTRTHVVQLGTDLPPDVPSFYLDGNVLSWGDVEAPDLAGYRIRYQPGRNLSWGDATPMHSGVLTDSPWTMPVHPLGPVSIMIRAVDVFGNDSKYSAVIRTDLGDVPVSNVVETIDAYAVGFPGAKTGCTVDGGDLIANDADGQMWSEDDSAAMWTDDHAPMWTDHSWSRMTYEHTLTPTDIKRGTQIVIVADIVGETWLIEYRKSGTAPMWTDDDAPMWTFDDEPMWATPDEWVPWPGSVLIEEGVEYDFRITVSHSRYTRGAITALAFQIDYPDIVETFNDVAIDAAGTRLPIAETYDAIKNVSVTLQEDGGSAVTLRVMDKDPDAGPLIQCFNSVGVAVDGVVDATVKGY